MISAANGFQITYFTIMNDVEGTCFIAEIEENGWNFKETVDITRRHRNSADLLGRCEYYNYNYTAFKNMTYAEALRQKDNLEIPNVQSCIGGKILLTAHSRKYHTEEIIFCGAKEVTKKLIVWQHAAFIIGPLFFGILGDLFGRRRIGIIVAFLWSCCSLSLAIMSGPSADFFYCFYVPACCFYIGCELLTYINLIEICHKKIRFFAVLTLYGKIMGFLLCTRFADNKSLKWSNLQFVSFSFTLCSLFHCWYAPESPRWLIIESKYKRALKVMAEIIGYVPNEILFEDEGSETPFSFDTIPKMFQHLWKRKLKILSIMTVISVILGFVKETQVWWLILSKRSLKNNIVAASADLMSLPYTLITYAALGKKYGLIWAILILTFSSFMVFSIQDSVRMEYATNAIIIMNAETAMSFIFAYIPDLLPTFLRCTGLGIVMSLSSLVRTITVHQINWEEFGNHKLYLMVLLCSLPGFFILKLPDTTHADLPTVRLYRN